MTFQSVGKNKPATFLSMLRSGLVFIPVLLILSNRMGLTGVQIAQTVTDVITFFVSIPFIVYFFKQLPKNDVEQN
jgi:Na+-driven multidrug efflux pump